MLLMNYLYNVKNIKSTCFARRSCAQDGAVEGREDCRHLVVHDRLAAARRPCDPRALEVAARAALAGERRGRHGRGGSYSIHGVADVARPSQQSRLERKRYAAGHRIDDSGERAAIAQVK